MVAATATPLRLRPERPWREHASLYRDLFADPIVASALWPGGLSRVDASTRASELLASDIAHWQRESFGPWVFFETTTGAFVGRGGLLRSTVAGEERVEVLYALRPDSWGRGYATEMAALAVTHAQRLGLGEVVGFTATTNVASRRVLEKAGLRFVTVFERAGLPHWLGRLLPAAERPAADLER